jgi:hypothetical protein
MKRTTELQTMLSCWNKISMLRFLFLVRIRTDAERSADMVQDDCRLRERPRQIRQDR